MIAINNTLLFFCCYNKYKINSIKYNKKTQDFLKNLVFLLKNIQINDVMLLFSDGYGFTVKYHSFSMILHNVNLL